MEGKEKVVKIGFFKKVWYSITKFEQYPTMAMEGLKRAIKYLVMLTAIVTIFITLGSLIQMKMMVEDLAEYVQNNIPEFSYTNGNLAMEIDETMIIEDIQYIDIDRIAINTLIETDEQKQQMEKGNCSLLGKARRFLRCGTASACIGLRRSAEDPRRGTGGVGQAFRRCRYII